VVHVPCDFSAPDFDKALAEDLARRGFWLGGGCLFVWEGVIGYIDHPTIDRSLAFMARAGGSRSRLAFTFGSMTFDPESAEVRARRAGFSSCEEHGFDEVWKQYLPGVPHPNAFVARIAVASFRE